MTVKKSPAITTHIAPRALPGRARKGAVTGFRMLSEKDDNLLRYNKLIDGFRILKSDGFSGSLTNAADPCWRWPMQIARARANGRSV
ncbi:hypothetical protein [Nisaea sediminum]|uniref:hypothetical protein n=1 Tax=Nisaea sediminum TaxID=2775867 RepID=UPI001D006E52|nr:hypothetical protein [Nisaea sediminum]